MKVKILLIALSLSTLVKAQSYTIYPVPQQQETSSKLATLRSPVAIIAEEGIDETTIVRAEQVLHDQRFATFRTSRPAKDCTNLLLGINGSKGKADKQAKSLKLSREIFTLPKYDRHILSVTANRLGVGQLLILGENTDAVFCGLASLEQMLEQPQFDLTCEESYPCVTIYDYADIRDRGVIEGYYGVPYSAEVTKDLFRFMARYKMNTYMYGAKSDPYHSQFWADPYPTSITPQQLRIGYLTQDMLREITDVSHATKVNFIWAIHPGTAFTDANNDKVLDQIIQKFSDMHRLGVRQFGVFVDDVGVPDDDATLKLGANRLTQLQSLIDERWNHPLAEPKDTVKPLHFVPQLYAFSWVKEDQAERFFKSLSTVPEKVRIYITGRNVWSVPNSEDLLKVQQWLGHETSWWWNYPCNDNDVTKLFPMDTYTNFHDEKHVWNDARLEPELRGTHTLISNPMQQGEASKIALFSIADYAWNNKAFDNLRSWKAALEAILNQSCHPALLTLAPYLRYFDADALASLAEAYKASVDAGSPKPEPLCAELKKVVNACRAMENLENSHRQSERLFYEDLRPWVLKLDAMASEAILRLQGQNTDAIDLDNAPDFQFPILTGLGSDIDLSVKTAEPASEVLLPLLIWLRERNNK